MKKIMGVGTVYLMIAQFVFLLSTYLIHTGLGRYFGPKIYGTFGVIMSIYLIVVAILTNGIPKAVSKIIAEKPAEKNTIIHLSLKIQFILVVIIGFSLIIFSKTIASILNDLSLTRYIIFIGVLVFSFGIYTLFMNGFLSGLKKFKQQALAGIVHDTTKLLCVAIFILYGLKLFAILSGYLVATFAGLTLAWLCLKKEGIHISIKEPIKKEKTINLRKKIIKLAFPLTIIALGFTLMRNVNILFLKSMLTDSAQIGFYTAAATLSNVPYLIFSALPTTLLPSISNSVATNNLKLTQKYISQSLRYLILLLLPLVALIAGTAKNLISLFYSSTYAPAGTTLSILAVSAFFLATFMTFGAILIGAGYAKTKMKIVLGLIPLLILSNLYLIPRLGIVGAALASLITSFSAAFITGIIIYFKFRILITPKSFLKISFCSSLLFAATCYWHYVGIYLLINYLVLGALYLLLLWLFGEINKEDFSILLQLLRIKKD